MEFYVRPKLEYFHVKAKGRLSKKYLVKILLKA